MTARATLAALARHGGALEAARAPMRGSVLIRHGERVPGHVRGSGAVLHYASASTVLECHRRGWITGDGRITRVGLAMVRGL